MIGGEHWLPEAQHLDPKSSSPLAGSAVSGEVCLKLLPSILTLGYTGKGCSSLPVAHVSHNCSQWSLWFSIKASEVLRSGIGLCKCWLSISILDKFMRRAIRTPTTSPNLKAAAQQDTSLPAQPTVLWSSSLPTQSYVHAAGTHKESCAYRFLTHI